MQRGGGDGGGGRAGGRVVDRVYSVQSRECGSRPAHSRYYEYKDREETRQEGGPPSTCVGKLQVLTAPRPVAEKISVRVEEED